MLRHASSAWNSVSHTQLLKQSLLKNEYLTLCINKTMKKVHADGNEKTEDLLEIIWESYDNNITLMCSVASGMPYSLQPYGQQLTRLLCPWDFPGKNTRVGCHFLLQGIFLTQGSNPCLLHWQADSLPLSHQGSPKDFLY